MDTQTLADAFDFLDDIRASGEINMFGARPYVAEEFDLSSRDAGRVVSQWMETFDGTSAATERAEKAQVPA